MGTTATELFAVMTGGFASVAGSTLVGYSLLGAPLKYLLAASVMNASASLIMAKAIYPETETSSVQASVRDVRDEESGLEDIRVRSARRHAGQPHQRGESSASSAVDRV